MMEEFNLEHWAHDWFLEQGLNSTWASYLTLAIDVLFLLAVSLLVDFIVRRIILRIVKAYVDRSKNKYDDVFYEKRVFQSLGHIIPAIIVYNSIPWVFDGVNVSTEFLQKLVTVYVVINITITVNRFLKALQDIGHNMARFEGKPVNSIVQVFVIINYIISVVLILSLLIGESPLTILTGFGAATAVILLIFRDTILGLVASIQISANDMVRLGDWVSMEKYGADGDVIEINLTTVKVRNWDKTISTVPTYAFISDSFKNWRGMENLGVRRIKRSINIDLNTIQFVDDTMRKQFMKYEIVIDYLTERQQEIDSYNNEKGVDKSELLNGRHMTNVGVFRAYALHYLLKHPKIDQNETIMVRQLQPSEKGLPLEVYAFSNDIAWVNYENIQGDIFDHLISAVPKFGLKLFQNPTGGDLEGWISKPE